MSTIRVNGQVIECDGASIVITSSDGCTHVTVDGKKVAVGNVPNITIEGNCGSIDCQAGGITVNGNVKGNIRCGGGCKCGDVEGNIQAGGGIHAGNVSGDLHADGGVICRR